MLGKEQAPWGWGVGGGGGVDGTVSGSPGLPARPGEGEGGGREVGEGGRYGGAEGPALTSRARPQPTGEGRPRPLPSPSPPPPLPRVTGNQKTGLVTRKQKLYRTADTVPDSRLLPRLSSFLAAAARRPHSSNTSRNPRLPASKMAPGYRLSSKTRPVKVPARREARGFWEM